MTRVRTLSIALFALPLAFLTACGGDGDTTTTAAPTPSAVATTAAAPAGAGDLALCKAADEAKVKMIAAMSADDSLPNVKKALSELSQSMSATAATGGGTEVATTMKAFSEEAAKSAAEPDPENASNVVAFEKAATEYEAACTKAGHTS